MTPVYAAGTLALILPAAPLPRRPRPADMSVRRVSASVFPQHPHCMSCCAAALELVIVRYTMAPAQDHSRRDEQVHLCRKCLQIALSLTTEES